LLGGVESFFTRKKTEKIVGRKEKEKSQQPWVTISHRHWEHRKMIIQIAGTLVDDP